ncbi:MAG: hypothetical protein M1510_09455 [Nitrospirae bacterium]|nr:hypothetical protein [Nitrospirota bacterium]MCL5237651.1 hypothetical protein [Nitrospirota bacterium]
MLRIITQILMGLMLLFGTITLTPKLLSHLRAGNLLKVFYFIVLWSVSLSFAIAAFYYAYSGCTE